MKIFQAYYDERHVKRLIPGLIPINTAAIAGDLLEYNIFKALRHEGDFGVVSWRFRQKTQLTDWEGRVRAQLRTHDAVIVNPFPGLDAVLRTCWDNHPKLMPFAQVDTSVFQPDIAFCSYIFAKRRWWDQYFAFIDDKLARLDPAAWTLGELSRDRRISHVPFLIERWLNHTLNGAWMWRYDRPHFEKKFGSADLWDLKQIKGTPEWETRRQAFNMDRIALQEFGKDPNRVPGRK